MRPPRRRFHAVLLTAMWLVLALVIASPASLAQPTDTTADPPLFADARYVRLYHCHCGIDAKRMLAENLGWAHSVALSSREIAALRGAVFYGPPPEGDVIVASACYFPRQYGFLFFDSRRKLIGLAAVNFRISEVDVVPDNPPSPDRATVISDTRALWRIVQAHRAQIRRLGC